MSTYQTNDKILFLDDEPNILKALSRLAGRFGYSVMTTSSSQEALQWVREKSFAVVVSDYRMPEMNGTEFLTQVKTLSPKSIRILLTGYADTGAAIQAVNDANVFRYLTKPWEESALHDTLESAFESFNLAEENIFLQKEVTRSAAALAEVNRELEKKVDTKVGEVKLLNKRLEANFLSTIKLMGSVAHRNSPTLVDHSKRVAQLCVEIAKTFGWNARQLFELKVAGFLHDLSESFDARNLNHPKDGYELIKMIPDLGSAYEYVLNHHAGTSSSSMGAQILHVVDAYDEALYLSQSAGPRTPQKVLFDLKMAAPKMNYNEDVIERLYSHLKSSGHFEEGQYEVEVSLISLRPQMILSRDLSTSSGKVFVPKDNVITPEYLEKIFRLHQEDPLSDEIFVYKSSIKVA